ncbi:MAG TPA: toll/interleukin-1 receptor domain-containing protein [Gammaproteobacteria bacterium]|nr:toll/interleukin-1 receptor domain-containing protein [Gammaproteobacteria bacterium]HIL96396.1 toll/interleukin-1 receptor domain-containing protein [Pseudomonadales bacterium]
MEEALEAARCVVVVWSNHSIKSQWVRTEAHEGLERKILVPLLLDDVKPPLAYRIRSLSLPERRPFSSRERI